MMVRTSHVETARNQKHEQVNMKPPVSELEELLTDSDPYVRAHIATVYGDMVSEQLKNDKSSVVRGALASESTNTDLLAHFVFDTSPYVSKVAVQRLYQLNTNKPN